MHSIVFWLMGSFSLSQWSDVRMILPYIVVGTGVILLYARPLNVMQLDEEQAQQLGINVERLKLILLGAATLITASRRVIRWNDRIRRHHYLPRRPDHLGCRLPFSASAFGAIRSNFPNRRRSHRTHCLVAHRDPSWCGCCFSRCTILPVSSEKKKEGHFLGHGQDRTAECLAWLPASCHSQ